MKYTSEQIRKLFLDYFARQGHRVCRSYPLVPPGDPTLLFTNAGMVQFKDVFTGRQKVDFKRAASSQKCVRAGGKHNDLENVGRTARHHTFFEMLGNFSFGDYFKREAIAFAWEFLTREVKLPPERLWVTVFAGDSKQNLPPDDEAERIWREEVGVPADRILRFGAKDNFWSMGDTGPCGPCSEIHYYQGEHLPCDRPGGCAGLACECDRYLEVWNLVFMQYERSADGRLSPLPAPSIDTGMGLERLAAVLQGEDSNYHTDLFRPLLELGGQLSGRSYGRSSEDDVSLRVIADHARAAAFLLADGVLPSNEGRGYVLRRIMRRAIRHGHRLGVEKPFFHLVCARVVEMMGGVYPELVAGRGLIVQAVEQEEISFRRTLESGLKKLRREVERLRSSGGRLIPGELVFELQATDGFPPDLTAVIAAEQGLEIDEPGYQKAFARHQEISSGELGLEGKEEIWLRLQDELGATEFLGYQTLQAEGRVLALVRPKDGGRQTVEAAGAGEEVEAIISPTPFYGESGGQVGDSGEARWPKGRARVLDCKKPAGELIVHRLRVEEGTLERGQRLELEVDGERRDHIRRNHSATHLLQAALRRVLGAHVNQSGSLVAPDYFRFDFSHFAALSPEQLGQVELLVNRMIQADAPVEVSWTDIEDARRRGATMLFGEKYGERVRLVAMGEFSRELCGGTHVEKTGQIGAFFILSEGSVKAGIRRIEGVTGEGALKYVNRLREHLERSCAVLRTSPAELSGRLEQLLEKQRQLEQQLEQLKLQKASGAAADPLAAARSVAGVRALGLRAEGLELAGLRNFADQLLGRLGSGVVLALTADGEKLAGACAVSKDLSGRLDARKVLQAVFAVTGGRAGGRADFAQGGGGRSEKAEAGLDEFYRQLEQMLKA